MAKLTIALFEKYKNFDSILINKTDSQVLPSWPPVPPSRRLPSLGYGLDELTTRRPNTRFCLGDSIGENLLIGDGKVLRLQGIAIGRILTMTSSTNPKAISSFFPTQSVNLVPFSDAPTSFSYYTSSQVFIQPSSRAVLSIQEASISISNTIHRASRKMPGSCGTSSVFDIYPENVDLLNSTQTLATLKIPNYIPRAFSPSS